MPRNLIALEGKCFSYIVGDRTLKLFLFKNMIYTEFKLLKIKNQFLKITI